MSQTRLITVSNEAADCLAFFTSYKHYGPTISDAIINLTKEWFNREGREYTGDLWPDFDYIKEKEVVTN
jgi:hypothetical protein